MANKSVIDEILLTTCNSHRSAIDTEMERLLHEIESFSLLSDATMHPIYTAALVSEISLQFSRYTDTLRELASKIAFREGMESIANELHREHAIRSLNELESSDDKGSD